MSLTSNIARAKTDYDEVYEAGKDTIWNMVLNNGNRTSFRYAFAYWANLIDSFYPPYDIKPKGSAINMFQSINDVMDLNARFEECGKVLDTKGCTDLTQAFYLSRFTVLPIIDLSGLTSAPNATFGDMYNLVEIKGVVPPVNVTWNAQAFRNDTELRDLTIVGTNAVSYLNLSWSKKLNKASITSVINSLSTTTPSGLSITLSETAVKTAFNTTDPSTCEEWLALRNTRSNWTISLQDS